MHDELGTAPRAVDGDGDEAPDTAGFAKLDGRVLSAAGRPLPERIPVWFAYRTTAGEATTVESETDRHGYFHFDAPTQDLQRAKIGSWLEGIRPVDLEPMGRALTPGLVVLIIDDLVPPHLRFACLG